jgi:flagella basal body P-ring formation protein FlgA
VGDHLIVEEHTKLLDASLEAIALASARAGQTLRVRLSIGGRVVKAIAAAAGRATLFPESGL